MEISDPLHSAQPSTESHPESADEIRDHKIHDLPPVPSCFVTAHGFEEVKYSHIAEIDKIYVDLQLEVAQDRKRITRLKTFVHIDRPFNCIDDLYPVMKRNSLRQVTFTQAAKLLSVTYHCAKQLRTLIEEDPRFMVVKYPRYKIRRLIRLTEVRSGWI